jgi:hypothetical protein
LCMCLCVCVYVACVSVCVMSVCVTHNLVHSAGGGEHRISPHHHTTLGGEDEQASLNLQQARQRHIQALPYADVC